MQTLQFTRSLAEIVKLLKAEEIVNFLAAYLNISQNVPLSVADKGRFSTLVFDSYAGYQDLLKNTRTSEIIRQLELGAIYDTARMGRMVSSFNNAPASTNLFGNVEVFTELAHFREQLRTLVVLEKGCNVLLQQEKIGKNALGSATLEIQLIDYEGKGIEPSRLSLLVETLVDLHALLAEILEIKEDILKLKYLDSGSDFILAIEAAAKIIESLRELFGEVWSKIIFWKYEKHDRKLDSIAKSLTIIGHVEGMAAAGQIPREKAANLSARLLKDVDKLIGIGATLPLGDRGVEVDQRERLIEMREVKLLGNGNIQSPEDGSEPNDKRKDSTP